MHPFQLTNENSSPVRHVSAVWVQSIAQLHLESLRWHGSHSLARFVLLQYLEKLMYCDIRWVEKCLTSSISHGNITGRQHLISYWLYWCVLSASPRVVQTPGITLTKYMPRAACTKSTRSARSAILSFAH